MWIGGSGGGCMEGESDAMVNQESQLSVKVGQPYHAWDGSGTFDAVVIGSGMGALTTAALLAKRAGRRVLVLERHDTAGGFTHVFQRAGYEWDVGVHYVGELHQPDSELRAWFDYVTDGRVDWAAMGEVYNRLIFPGAAYDLVAGEERLRERLKEYFPGEARAIDRYLSLVTSCARASFLYFAEKALPAPLAGLAGPLLRMPFLRHARQTTGAVLAGLTHSRELIGTLTGQWLTHGLPPGRSSFGIHAIIAWSYLQGAAYPVGGAGRIAAAMEAVIKDAGGKVVIDAEVAQIVVEHGRAMGVRMSDGREIRAGWIISGVGVFNTFTRLLPEPVAASAGLRDDLRSLEPSLAHLNLYVGLGHTDRELGLGKSNLLGYPSPDHDRNLADFLTDPERPFPFVYISSPSAKDPTFAERYPGRATIQVMSFAPYEWFQRWENAPWGRRGEDYEALKQRLGERLLEKLYEFVPAVRGKVDHWELSTPVTTRYFANYAHGEIYGLAPTPARFRLRRLLRPQTSVRNLYLTGQDIVTSGILGAMMGGFLCASAILGGNLLLIPLFGEPCDTRRARPRSAGSGAT